MLQDYLRAYLPPSHADAYSQIQQMAQWLDVHLSKYPAQYVNCMTSDSKFVALVNHAIQLALDLTIYLNIWAVLLILLETQDVNTSYVQTMHDYYNQCYNTRTQEYMVLLEKAAEQLKNNMYNNTLDGVLAYVQQSMCNSPAQLSDQHDANAENHTQVPYHTHFNDLLTEYPAWSTDTNDMENTNQAQYRSDRQEILNAWQKDTTIKMPDNRQVLDNLEAYMRDKLSITRPLHDRLGLTKNSLPGAQTVTVAVVQSDQLTTRIPNYLPKNIAIGQQNDSDNPDDRNDYLYQVDGTTDVHTPTDHSADDEDTEPDNNTCKRQRKVYAPADTNRKELTKQRQAQVLKNQQEKERLKAQTLEDRDNIDKSSRTKSKTPTPQPEYNSENDDNTNSPRLQRAKGKTSHPSLIKSLKNNRKMPRASGKGTVPNDPPLDPDTPDEDPLIGDLIDTEDDSDYPLGPDELGFYTFFLKGEGNPPDLLGIEDDQLLAIQNDLHNRMKARDEARERAISKKLCELEQKHEFANTQYLKHFAQVSELLEPSAKDAPARVKPADKIPMLPPCSMVKNLRKQKLIMKGLIST